MRKRKRVDDGFTYWPTCPKCGNIAVSCIGRDPENSVPAFRYRMACDHGDQDEWPGTGFCGHRWWVLWDEIRAVQAERKRAAAR